MITEIEKRFDLLSDIESFEQRHQTVLENFRKDNKFPMPKGHQRLNFFQKFFHKHRDINAPMCNLPAPLNSPVGDKSDVGRGY